MAETTGIEWAHSTVNIWEGCTKVSPACKHCYAETNSPVRAMETRIGEALQVEPSEDGKRRLKMWGVDGFRYETANWERELRRLNRRERHMREQFGEDHRRRRIFINSLSDTFEDWQGPVYRLEDGKPVVVAQSLDGVRQRFFRVAEECTELDILLLTKRPENVLGMVPMLWAGSNDFARTVGKWPSHISIGATVESQEHADKRIPELLKVPAKVRFLSVEPLLGPIDFVLVKEEQDTLFGAQTVGANVLAGRVETRFRDGTTYLDQTVDERRIHWVIVGGESGKGARPMHPDWARAIRDQCVAAGVPFFFKQWGEWAPSPEIGLPYHFGDGDHAFRVGKRTAGRVLDGRTWDEVPR